MSTKEKLKTALYNPWSIHSIRSLRQFFSVSRSFKSYLTAFKEFPFIGWALLLVDEGLILTRAALDKKTSKAERITAFLVGPIKIALGTVSILLPLVMASAALAVAAPICGMCLSIIDAGQAIKGAVQSILKMKKNPSPMQKHLMGHAITNMILGVGIAVAAGFLLFFPGAQIIAASVIASLVIFKLINFSIQHGKLTKPTEASAEMVDAEVQTDEISNPSVTESLAKEMNELSAPATFSPMLEARRSERSDEFAFTSRPTAVVQRSTSSSHRIAS